MKSLTRHTELDDMCRLGSAKAMMLPFQQGEWLRRRQSLPLLCQLHILFTPEVSTQPTPSNTSRYIHNHECGEAIFETCLKRYHSRFTLNHFRTHKYIYLNFHTHISLHSRRTPTRLLINSVRTLLSKTSSQKPVMANNDLAKYVTSDTDFYTLLGLPSTTFTESELRRAYRKTSLKYHPDKLGADFDPAKYELFQAAYGVLESEELRAKYDAQRTAKLQKQRANELFEGKRRAMKEDLEARERGAEGTGFKRSREEEEGMMEMRRLAEEGRKRRAEREKMMGLSSPAPAQAKKEETSAKDTAERPTSKPVETKQEQEEDEVAVLERRIREAAAAKEKRKADKRARKSGVFTASVSESPSKSSSRPVSDGLPPPPRDTLSTPIKKPLRHDLFKGLKSDDHKISASPRFSFSPAVATPKRKDFTATMERLKAAEKARMEQEIRRQEEEETAAL